MPIDARRIIRAGRLALASLVAITATAASPVQGRRARVDAHATARLPVILADLGLAQPDAVLLMGNSHAEMAGETRPRTCMPAINAGIGGAKARDYAAALPHLWMSMRPRLAVLLIGTNDILRGDRPLSAMARARFAADSASIVAWMQAHAESVIVVAVPPIGASAVGKRDPAAVAAYSEILRGLCRAPGCRFADPFASLRDGEGGIASAQALPDAIHLADYPAMLAALGLCNRVLPVPDRAGAPMLATAW